MSPLSQTSSKVLGSMKRTYGSKKKAEEVFYATASKKGDKAEKASTWRKPTNESSFAGLAIVTKDVDAHLAAFIAGTTSLVIESDKPESEKKSKTRIKSIREMVELAFEASLQTSRTEGAGTSELDQAAAKDPIIAAAQQDPTMKKEFWQWNDLLNRAGKWWGKVGPSILKNRLNGDDRTKMSYDDVASHLRWSKRPQPKPEQPAAQPAAQQPAAQSQSGEGQIKRGGGHVVMYDRTGQRKMVVLPQYEEGNPESYVKRVYGKEWSTKRPQRQPLQQQTARPQQPQQQQVQQQQQRPPAQPAAQPVQQRVECLDLDGQLV